MQTSTSGQPAPSGSSFYAAMRVLPPAQRRAMFAVYQFCRAVDDVADGPGAREARFAELERWRADLGALFAGEPSSRVVALEEPVRTFALRCEDFLAVIDGVEMDVAADIVAPELATLDIYCDRVACAVGRLSVRIFGMQEIDGESLASHLGRALQLTNILRDLDEDAGNGRLYLPREVLRAAGIASTDPAAVLSDAALNDACVAVARLARVHFAEAGEILARYPPRIARAPLIMAKVYENILDRLIARGWQPPRRAVRAGRSRMAWILVRYGLIGSDSSVSH